MNALLAGHALASLLEYPRFSFPLPGLYILFTNLDWMASASGWILFPCQSAFHLSNLIVYFSFRIRSAPAANYLGFRAHTILLQICGSLYPLSPISLSLLLDPACGLLLLECQGTRVSGFSFFVSCRKTHVRNGQSFKSVIKLWSISDINYGRNVSSLISFGSSNPTVRAPRAYWNLEVPH